MRRKLKLLRDIILKPSVMKEAPYHLQLEVTNACNLDCVMCWRSDIVDNPRFLDFETVKKVIDEAAPKKMNIFGLGEPLLNKDLFKMIEYAVGHGIKVALTTNMVAKKDKIEKLYASGINLIKISIDAATKETYLKIRKRDEFDNIIENIKILNSLKKENKTRTPYIRFNFAVQDRNIKEIETVLDIARNNKIDSVYYQYLKFYDHEDQRSNIVGEIDGKNLYERLKHAEQRSKELKVKTNISVWLRDYKLFSNRFMPSVEDNSRFCYFPWMGTFIEATGEVKPCPVLAWRKGEGAVGNIFNDSFKDIWNNSEYIKFRKDFKNKNRPTEICRTCLPFSIHDFFDIASKSLPGFGLKKDK